MNLLTLRRAFTCIKCGTFHDSVEQQFQFTEPTVCRNPQCSRGEIWLNHIIKNCINLSCLTKWKYTDFDVVKFYCACASIFLFSLRIWYIYLIYQFENLIWHIFLVHNINLNVSKSILGSFQLSLDRSAFVDWQRLRVQENADEIPPGTLVIIFSHLYF